MGTEAGKNSIFTGAGREAAENALGNATRDAGMGTAPGTETGEDPSTHYLFAAGNANTKAASSTAYGAASALAGNNNHNVGSTGADRLIMKSNLMIVSNFCWGCSLYCWVLCWLH
jgi:hypothetical protein